MCLGHGGGLQRAALFELCHDLAGQYLQRALLNLGERTRTVIEDAERPDRQALFGLEQGPGVRADVRRTGDQGIACESSIQHGVGHDEKVMLEQGMDAEGGFERSRVEPQADFGLEELPLGIDEVDHRDRDIADRCDQIDDLVERSLSRRIHDAIASECGEALRLAIR
jgi:hypothetical protein